jgi:mono/diheme cytochrome c family protein
MATRGFADAGEARARDSTGMSETEADRPEHRRWRRWVLRGAVGLAVVLVAIQVVPYGRSHTNPATTNEPSWDSPRTRQLFMSACGDCHSNQTKWPWYTNIAPVSWLTQRDVDSGRASFDVSNWDRPQDVSAGDMAEAIRGGGMPPWFYTPLHSAANLSSAEKDTLIAGLARTLAASPPIAGG